MLQRRVPVRVGGARGVRREVQQHAQRARGPRQRAPVHDAVALVVRRQRVRPRLAQHPASHRNIHHYPLPAASLA
ncbi:unnamed protein product [Arctia plantaginis]|uniref:Uncharacterized protein n=1 Tax=Arctia plantaginis TaxID=874455 RepID=A0A8S1BJR1_ARCPL|nr:unnamed protein product [Arctia plantaginis]